MSEDKKETPTELDVLEGIIKDKIRLANEEISRQTAYKDVLFSIKNDIEYVRDRFQRQREVTQKCVKTS